MAYWTPGNDILIEQYGFDWEEKLLTYYGPSSNIWQKINNSYNTATYQEIAQALDNIPQVQPMRSVSGKTLGLDYSTPIPFKEPSNIEFIVSDINSNAIVPSYNSGNSTVYNVPSYTTESGGQYSVKSGAVNGSNDLIATVADKVKLAELGVRLGAKLGIAIDEALYNAAPDFWDEHFPTLNPETWGELAGKSEAGDFFLRELLGIDPQGKLQGYLSEEALAYTYMVLRDNGAFGEDYHFPDTETQGQVNISGSLSAYEMLSVGIGELHYPVSISASVYSAFDSWINNINTSWFTVYTSPNATEGSIIQIHSLKKLNNPVTLGYKASHAGYFYFSGNLVQGTLVLNRQYHSNSTTEVTATYFIGEDRTNPRHPEISGLNATAVSALDGVSFMDTDKAPYGVPSPSVITGTNVNDVLQQLKQNYPDLFTDSITESVLQEDGTIAQTNYVPVPQLDPNQLNKPNPTTGDMTQISTEVKPETLQKIDEDMEKTPQAPDTGTGNAPGIVLPTGHASSLWAVYHPSQAQLSAFGAWLWSSDFVEQIKRLFNDPMQAVIGVHKVFAPIPTGETRTIVCGYLDSGVSSPTVSSQYAEIDCGTVDCREYFGNVFDYDPYTKVSIYLPFIGVVPLKVSEVMRANINVSYGVDVITGACLAKVKVMRDGGGGILYSYGGSCACHYPISSGSYAGIISGIVTSAIGIAGGIATGNPLAAIGGTVAGLHQAHTDVQRSGGFTGCAGAMGPKKPYLIIDRPQTKLAANFETYQGKPANSTQFIGDCSGFVRAKEVHFSAPGAFDDEAKEVVALLKSGVLIND